MAENPRIEELRRRVQADPASIAFAALAEEFRRLGRYDEAVDTCRTGLMRHPAYLSARVTLGRALIETGDLDGARVELETVLHSAPENLAAIRGLAQIHERLGHSTKMDPHLADLMKTMHAESIRVAALPPPEPPAAAPEPVPAPAPEPEADLSMALETPRVPSLESSADPFAGFAPMSKPEPAPDFSFDLDVADLAMTPPLDLPIAPVEEPVDPGPDPEILATLARLERFLGAIQSLRA